MYLIMGGFGPNLNGLRTVSLAHCSNSDGNEIFDSICCLRRTTQQDTVCCLIV